MMRLRWACLNYWWYLFILLPYSVFTIFNGWILWCLCIVEGEVTVTSKELDLTNFPVQNNVVVFFAMKYILVAIFDWRVDIESIFHAKIYNIYKYIQLSRAIHSHKMYLLHWIPTGNQAVLSIFNVNVITLNPMVLELDFFHGEKFVS